MNKLYVGYVPKLKHMEDIFNLRAFFKWAQVLDVLSGVRHNIFLPACEAPEEHPQDIKGFIDEKFQPYYADRLMNRVPEDWCMEQGVTLCDPRDSVLVHIIEGCIQKGVLEKIAEECRREYEEFAKIPIARTINRFGERYVLPDLYGHKIINV